MVIKIGDRVMICNTSTSYFQRGGVVQSIDIYGLVKVKIDGIEAKSIKVKREDLKVIGNHQVKGSIIDEKKTASLTVFSKNNLKDLINISLDTSDKEWFLQLTKKLSDVD